jgi:hypothetical protein
MRPDPSLTLALTLSFLIGGLSLYLSLLVHYLGLRADRYFFLAAAQSLLLVVREGPFGQSHNQTTKTATQGICNVTERERIITLAILSIEE